MDAAATDIAPEGEGRREGGEVSGEDADEATTLSPAPNFVDENRNVEHCSGSERADESGPASPSDFCIVGRAEEEGEDGEHGFSCLKPSSPFDRLPDELVLQILQAVRAGILLPTRDVEMLVNKRMYRLAQSIWNSRWIFDEVVARRPSPAVCAAIQHLQYGFPDIEIIAEVRGRAIGTFANLTSLQIDLISDVDDERTVFLPKTLTDSLRSLKHLQDLTFFDDSDGTCDFEDKDFSIATDLPSLRSLHLGALFLCVGQLLTPPPTFEHLYVFTYADDPALQLLPWATVDSLSLSLGQPTGMVLPLQEVNKGLQTALYPIPTDMRNLLTFLAAFPALERLHLRQVKFGEKKLPPRRSTVRPSVNFLHRHPALRGLIDHLYHARTNVLVLSWEAEEVKGESYRWERESPEMPFTARRYRAL
ncbi:hypothetical protein JCM8097_009016 [Rhodosporidiobolus ruineniae]